MLYISRRVHYRGAVYDVRDDSALRFGVVDTDDNEEQFVSINALRQINSEGKVQISGVDKQIRSVRDVHPYQINASPLQMKMRMLKGVSVVTWNDKVVDISWDNSRICTPVSVRLSDFATICGDFVLYGVDITHGHKITLILDDNIKITDASFEVWPYVGPDGIGVVFDLKELTNPNYLNVIYKTVFRSLEAYDEHDYPVPVIDFGSRITEMNKKFSNTLFEQMRWL